MRGSTFGARPDLDLLFILVDNVNGAISTAWLVLSDDFDQLHGKPTTKGGLRFSASTKDDSKDQWSVYRHTAAELPLRIVERLEGLEL